MSDITPRSCRLPLKVDQDRAKRRMARLGARSMELVALPLWAFALRDPRGRTPAFLLACHSADRVLLWPHALPDDAAWQVAVTPLPEAEAPSPEWVMRAWLWERLTLPRRWSLKLDRSAATHPVSLPVWIGYRPGRSGMQVLLISGVGGEPLPALKPAVLAGLTALAPPAG
ncbi:hypothetical protein GCM10027040_10220 [Halomonas shantousis]